MVEDRQTLRTHIANLRRKIELGGAPGVIRTEHGVGYRFADTTPARGRSAGVMTSPARPRRRRSQDLDEILRLASRSVHGLDGRGLASVACQLTLISTTTAWVLGCDCAPHRARDELDRRLAEGADPDSDPLLHTRAERLVTPASRAVLAAGLERAVAAAYDPGAALSSSAPVRRGPVRGARHELMGLAGDLRHMPHPRPRGVAMAELLLTEGSSVLFTAESSAEVARAARDAVDHLRATSPEEPGALDDLLGFAHRVRQ